MPITRYDIWGPDYDSDEAADGDWCRWDDVESYLGRLNDQYEIAIGKLEHIISGANDEIRRLAEENTRLKFEIAGGLESRAPRENALIEGATFVDHTEE